MPSFFDRDWPFSVRFWVEFHCSAAPFWGLVEFSIDSHAVTEGYPARIEVLKLVF